MPLKIKSTTECKYDEYKMRLEKWVGTKFISANAASGCKYEIAIGARVSKGFADDNFDFEEDGRNLGRFLEPLMCVPFKRGLLEFLKQEFGEND